MIQLLGEYDCKIDTKGRVRMPTDVINQLGEGDTHTFVINRGFEKCLVLYPELVWSDITKKVNTLNSFNKDHRKFLRYFFRGAQKVSLDSSDRILINKRLLEYAEIDKEIILSAVQDKIEVWSPKLYDDMLNIEPDEFADLAEELLGSNYGYGMSDGDNIRPS